MRVGGAVRVKGFKVASHFYDQSYGVNEQKHINTYIGKVGEVVEVDGDRYHPVHVLFPDTMPKVCRFSPVELEKVEEKP